MYIDPFCLSDFWSRLKCKWEAREVRLSGWHSDKCPSAITPQTPFQQFHSDYTTHPVTFTSEHGPRMQKVSNFWTEHLFISSFRRLGGPRGSIWIFLPVSSLLLFAVTLENSAQQFSPCCHLDSAVTSKPPGLIVMDCYPPPRLLKCKQEKVWHMGRHHPFPIKSHTFWFGSC